MLTPEQLAFALSQRVGRLATSDASAQPQVIPVCFAWFDGCFWVAIDEKPKRSTNLKRLRNIAANARVSLLFDRYDDDWSRLAYVLVHGTAEVVAAGASQPGALAALRGRYQQYVTMALEARPLVRIAPGRVTSWGAIAPE